MPAIPKSGRRTSIAVAAVFVVLSCVASASAVTLEDYRHQVSRAHASIQELLAASADQYPSQREQFVAATIALVRAELPAQETVLLGRQTVAVDNTWLHEALNNLEKVRADSAQRAELVAHIDERLRALGERLDEMQNGQPGASKDDNKTRLAEILRRSEYSKQAEEGSALTRLINRFLRWLAGLFPQAKPLQPGNAMALSRVAQVVVIGVSVAAIGLLIWKFGPRYLRNRRKKKPRREARIVLGERLEPDQTSADLLAQAELLARSGDLRAAIRKAYIALLCELGDRKVISLAQHKTNRDYLGAVRDRPSLFLSMRGLTNSFEIHWYGFVPPVEDDWKEFRNGYQQALKTPNLS
jgi:Domain of unknown function (DUF4129)